MIRALPRFVLLLALAFATSSFAQAYKRTQMQSGADLCLYWSDRQYTYHLDQAGYSAIPFNDMELTVQKAFTTWQTLSSSCSGYSFTEGAPLATAGVGFDPFGANYNTIMFREKACSDVVPPNDPCLGVVLQGKDTSCDNVYKCWDHAEEVIALTTVTYDVDAGVIYDADIEVNAGPDGTGVNRLFTNVDGQPCDPAAPKSNCIATDLQNTLTHEIGHVIGLAHVDGGYSTMFATANIGETQKRIIDYGTQQGFCGIYPANGPSSAACDLTSQSEAVTATNQGTPQVACTVSPGGKSSVIGWATLGLTALLFAKFRRRGGTNRGR